MDIYYLGHSSFKFKSKSATLVIDPYDEEFVGFKFPKNVAADAVLVTHNHPDHNHIQAVGNFPDQQKLLINGPGEYEVKGVEIIGIRTFHDNTKGNERGSNTVYHIKMDGVSLVHLGDLGHKLDEAEVDLLDGVDILFVPVGGKYCLNAQDAVSVVNQLEPSIVIPMHYVTSKHDPKSYKDVAPVADFLKQIGKESVVPAPKLSVTKDKLPEEMQVVVLE